MLRATYPDYHISKNKIELTPEIDVDKINKISGLDITFVTSAKTDEEAKMLLKEFGVPFQGQKNQQ